MTTPVPGKSVSEVFLASHMTGPRPDLPSILAAVKTFYPNDPTIETSLAKLALKSGDEAAHFREIDNHIASEFIEMDPYSKPGVGKLVALAALANPPLISPNEGRPKGVNDFSDLFRVHSNYLLGLAAKAVEMEGVEEVRDTVCKEDPAFCEASYRQKVVEELTRASELFGLRADIKAYGEQQKRAAKAQGQ